MPQEYIEIRVATAAQRQTNGNFSMFIRTFLPRYSQPDADAIENLSMPIVVDQKRLGGGSHSTMGTITDIYSVLRRCIPTSANPMSPAVSVRSRRALQRDEVFDIRRQH
jgi:excinuclease UvrABC ATPase subunit